MQFTRQGKFLRVSRITGPTHNLLGLHLSPTPGPDPTDVIDLTPGNAEHGLDGGEVRRWVAKGVEEANALLGTRLHLYGIEFCSTDSPPERIYKELAIRLVEHAASRGEDVT